jgi:hypothetical protein
MAFDVNSVPLSETIIPGLPRLSINAVNSRATRRPEIEVSGIAVEQEWQRLSEAEEEASMVLINIEPTTLAGAAHLMRYVVEHEAKGNTWPQGLVDDDTPPTAIGKTWSFYLHKNLAALLEAA